MKRLGLTIGFTFLLLILKGESPVNLGIKFGTNSSSLITNVNEGLNNSNINNYFAGAFARLSLGRLYLQPEAYFNTKGGFIGSIDYTTAINPDLSEVFRYQTIDIPILIGIKVINKSMFNFRICAGPVLSYVTVKPAIDDFSNFDINELKNNYVGIQAGIGVDIWFLTVDARIENSFNIFNTNSNYSASNRIYLLSAGIKLF